MIFNEKSINKKTEFYYTCIMNLYYSIMSYKKLLPDGSKGQVGPVVMGIGCLLIINIKSDNTTEKVLGRILDKYRDHLLKDKDITNDIINTLMEIVNTSYCTCREVAIEMQDKGINDDLALLEGISECALNLLDIENNEEVKNIMHKYIIKFIFDIQMQS